MGLKHRWSIESLSDALLKSEKREFEAARAGRIHLGLIFPAPYALGISNLGFQTVHRIAASTPDIGVERFFIPLQTGVPHPPPYYSFESKRPLGDFDVLAFSLSFEGDFHAIAAVLGPLGIPVLAEERRRKRFPLLLAGGAAVGSNPAALSRIFDILVPGEAETVLPDLLKRFLSEGVEAGTAADLPGVWAPAYHSAPNPPRPPHDVASEPAYAHIISEKNVFGGAALFEIMRGCPRACAFCLARVLYYPARPVPTKRLVEWLDQRPETTELGLVAPSLFDHPELISILELLAGRGIRLRNSSVKWEALSDQILGLLAKCGPRALTLAPETGSLRLRADMSKPLSEERFFATLDRIWHHGFESVKLYFMIGLPEETDADLEETAAFIAGIADKTPSGKSLSATFSGFVPKGGTAWQDCSALPATEFKRKFALLRSVLKHSVPRLSARFESPEDIVQQAYLAKVGPELADTLNEEAHAWRRSGRFQNRAWESDF
ncbi:MAG: radical SAM protein [Candidatus Riflebacteria bacterium]|nr:radical SAM protein [Candidatus Riflebacteria bacterium]